MQRLDRNESLMLLRDLMPPIRDFAAEAIGLVSVSVKHEPQKKALHARIRKAQKQTVANSLKILQDMGFVDKGITMDDLRFMAR